MIDSDLRGGQSTRHLLFGNQRERRGRESGGDPELLRLHHFDHEWTLPSRMDDNPLIWMLNVNGFMMDIRRAPREVQQVAFEKGLIPYIPADRP